MRSYVKTVATLSLLLILCLPACKSADMENPDSISALAIKEAESSIAITDAPLLGSVPSLAERRSLALEKIKNMREKSIQELTASPNTNDPDRPLKEIEDINNACALADIIVKDEYGTQLREAGEALKGKEIKASFDSLQYSSARVVIDHIGGAGTVYCKASLTLAKPLVGGPTHTKFVNYVWLAPDGKELASGVAPLIPGKDSFRNVAGGDLTVQIYGAGNQLTNLGSVRFLQD